MEDQLEFLLRLKSKVNRFKIKRSMINLSHLDIIDGKLDWNTPNIVIEDMAKTYPFSDFYPKKLVDSNYRKLVISCINNAKIISIPNGLEEITENDLRLLARFINPDEDDWNMDQLTTATIYLFKFKKQKNRVNISPDFLAGSQTVNNPERMNSIVVYSALKIRGIELKPKTTFDQMVKILRMYLNSDRRILTNIFRNYINSSTFGRTAILNMLISMGETVLDDFFNCQDNGSINNSLLSIESNVPSSSFSNGHITQNEKLISLSTPTSNESILMGKQPRVPHPKTAREQQSINGKTQPKLSTINQAKKSFQVVKEPKVNLSTISQQKNPKLLIN